MESRDFPWTCKRYEGPESISEAGIVYLSIEVTHSWLERTQSAQIVLYEKLTFSKKYVNINAHCFDWLQKRAFRRFEIARTASLSVPPKLFLQTQWSLRVPAAVRRNDHPVSTADGNPPQWKFCTVLPS